jgi:hypothetical protein
MTNYFDEMFEYLTKKDNYLAAKEIADLLPSVEKKMVLDFWNAVEEKLKLNIKIGWEVHLENYDNYFCIKFKKSCWNDIAIGLDAELDYGIWFNRINFNSTKIIEITEKHREITATLSPDNQGWFCFKPIPNIDTYRFNSKEKLLRILPTSRESLILEIALLITTYANDAEIIIDELNTCHL